jgi:hypothetical protein
MTALKTWNGGVIIISHDEKFITTVASEVRPYVMLFVCQAHIGLSALGLWRWHRQAVQGRCSKLQGNILNIDT